MILEELTTFITTLSTAFSVPPSTSANVYANKFPSGSPDTAVALYETGGTLPQFTFTGVDHERPTLQVISRSTSYPTARTNAQTIWSGFAAEANSTLGSTGNPTYLTITPQQSPIDIGEDSNQRHMVSCNYLIEKGVS